MSSESVEVQLARADERWKAVHEELIASRQSRDRQDNSMTALNQSVTAMDGRLKNVESQLATAQPTIQEFITIKHKVVGAGKLGKWLWVFAAGLIGLIAGSREAIFHWLSTKGA